MREGEQLQEVELPHRLRKYARQILLNCERPQPPDPLHVGMTRNACGDESANNTFDSIKLIVYQHSIAGLHTTAFREWVSARTSRNPWTELPSLWEKCCYPAMASSFMKIPGRGADIAASNVRSRANLPPSVNATLAGAECVDQPKAGVPVIARSPPCSSR
jgi:hypothetical protein